ncbi:uncharacterized protein LOC141706007 [Apium graveolens]|uniref:uncharacterized protein LOC141706007 n=1 Tax=Apium graveolens TaxID=4045 RepID=UPI003D7B264D
MDNLEHSQTIDGKVAANNESQTITVESSAAMIPPAGAENQNEDDDICKLIPEIPWEEFDLEDLNFLPFQKPPAEICNNGCQLPLEFGHPGNQKMSAEQYLNPNEAKFNTLTPELRSLIKWQSENARFEGHEAALATGAIGNPKLGAEKNKKRKGLEVDDNYQNNARVMRRGAPTSEAFEFHTHPGRKSSYSINDKLMELHELVPGSQKADMATTLGETVQYLAQVRIREHLLQEEIKQLREAMGSILMHSSVHGIPLNMGVNTEFGGLESPWAHPPVRMFNSSISTMNKPSLLQQNSNASASSSFQPPQVSAPTRWQSTLQDKEIQERIKNLQTWNILSMESGSNDDAQRKK